MSSEPRHIPVLPGEIVETLAPAPGETILDCTAGLGGHAAALAKAASPGATVVLFDLDPGNLARAADRVREEAGPVRVIAHHASFVEAPRRLVEAGLAADVVLADLGFSSNQMSDPARGLSFSAEGPLDMRLNPEAPITAAELVNSLTERELADLLREFGEEAHARAIARNLVRERQARPISTTAQFAAAVRDAVPARERYGGSIDPATRSFQALRIAVNDELGNLASLLKSIEHGAARLAAGEPRTSWLGPGARIGIISFHSLEDRQVKHAFSALADRDLAVLLTRKPITASEAELAVNPRARSAKFRAVRLGGAPPSKG